MTRCCTSTSSGWCGVKRSSTCPASAAARTAAASTSSRLWVGTSVMRDGRPGAWPERPARCSSRATPLVEPICSTRSTGKKSTPKSRLDVQITALSWPLFSAPSTHSRTALSSEPWCSASTPAQSGRASSTALNHSSACDRVFVNTRQVLLLSISAITCGSMAKPRWPAQGKRWVCLGSRVSITSVLGVAPLTSTPFGWPSSVCIASFRLPSVADIPQTHKAPAVFAGCEASAAEDVPFASTPPGGATGPHQVLSRASASWVCTPRLLPSSSCHSSTTTMRTEDSASRASALASMTDRLSGVVTSTDGQRRACALRSVPLVSPVRRPMLQGRRPGWAASASIGACNARTVSKASARIGVIHSTVNGCAFSGARFAIFSGALQAVFAWTSALKDIKAAIHTAYVLPAPVVACSRPDSPRPTAAHTAF